PPEEERELLRSGYGITNMVDRATLAADELSRRELIAGARTLENKVRRYRPRVVAILGLSAYRLAFEIPDAAIGLQRLALGPAQVWVLPNPSGLNAHFTPKTLALLFLELRRFVDSVRVSLPKREPAVRTPRSRSKLASAGED
ncbi:MAG TPA: mismatch-specific DNA-glycosylase, partial [Verrucomicrobiae bacterium]|nr:mismatch-specific DNA-glycosylase [Verrucomicrobiae bacterium]